MTITLEQLYEMQKELDARIIREKGLEAQDLLAEKILALQVEVGELANEWRKFKFWSTDRTPRTEKMLAEYVDCLHFVLSIGIAIGVTNPPRENLHEELSGAMEAFQHVFNWCATLDYVRAQNLWNGKGNAYRRLVDVFLSLGYLLGFSWQQITAAYLEKNNTNHERQANGY